ncbi:MAG: diguanylate cyclase, partial [Frankiales bacterium]|nr:diguanylate cyclase [Frankiales bacterium]
MEELLGAPAAEVVGRDALGMYAPEDRDALESALADLAEGRTHYVQQEHTLLRADGSRLRVVMTVTTVVAEDGSTVLAGSAQDLTAVRAAEQAATQHAERLDALLRAVPGAVWTFDADGVCTTSQGRAVEHFGAPDGGWVGQPLLEAYAEEPAAQAALQACLAGVPVHTVLDLVGRVWDCHYSPLRDDAGRVVGGTGIAVDVTGAATAEREVRANERRLRALLRSAADVALVLDRRGTVRWVGASVAAHFGHQPQTLLGSDSSELDHPDDRPVIEAAWRRVLAAPETVERVEA